MPTYGGVDSKGKIIKVVPYQLEGNDRLLWLTERQRGLLLAMTEYLDWRTRWAELPSPLDDDDYRDSYISNLKSRLMQEIEFCSEMIKCLDDDTDTQRAIERIIDRYNGGTGRSPGDKASEEELNRDFIEGSNPTCDLDILYAQCYQVVKMTHDAIMDFIQKVLTVTNATELVENFWNSIPFLAVLDDVFGVQGIVDFFQYVIEAIGEGYEGQFTETPLGTHDELAYALFCACRVDCNITIARIVRVLSSRLAVYTSPPSLSGMVNLLEQLFLIEQDTSFIVDLMFYTAWGLVDTAGFLFGVRFDRLLEVVVKMKADEPNNDWTVLELPENFGACPNCTIEYTILEGTEVIPE